MILGILLEKCLSDDSNPDGALESLIGYCFGITVGHLSSSRYYLSVTIQTRSVLFPTKLDAICRDGNNYAQDKLTVRTSTLPVPRDGLSDLLAAYARQTLMDDEAAMLICIKPSR